MSDENSVRDRVRVWIVEDNREYREAVRFALDSEDGLVCEEDFHSAEALLERLREQKAPEVILCDLDLPGMHGLDAIPSFKEVSPRTHILVLTQFDDRPKVFQAIGAGASGYLLKSAPLDEIHRSITEVMEGGAPLNARIAKMMLTTFSSVPPADGEAELTPRELEVLSLLAEGYAKKQIADELEISYHTVDMHVRAIYQKLQVHNLSGAVAKAIRRGLI
ncbi:MAG: response regulator transcription factor [Verrucomicrobiota bacterium]